MPDSVNNEELEAAVKLIPEAAKITFNQRIHFENRTNQLRIRKTYLRANGYSNNGAWLTAALEHDPLDGAPHEFDKYLRPNASSMPRGSGGDAGGSDDDDIDPPEDDETFSPEVSEEAIEQAVAVRPKTTKVKAEPKPSKSKSKAEKPTKDGPGKLHWNKPSKIRPEDITSPRTGKGERFQNVGQTAEDLQLYQQLVSQISPRKTASQGAIDEFVFNHKPVPWKSIELDGVPCIGALVLLWNVKNDENAWNEFWKNMRKGSGRGQSGDRFVDDGRHLNLLAAYEESLDRAEAGDLALVDDE